MQAQAKADPTAEAIPPGKVLQSSTSFNILDLLDDVLLEVFSLLRIDDIMRMRRVCRRMYEISTTFSLWSGMFRRFCSKHPHLTPTLEVPLEDQPLRDFEHLVDRLQTLERHVWPTAEGEPPVTQEERQIRSQTLQVGYAGSESLLTPGGRWLLVRWFGDGPKEDLSSIMFFDLDSPDAASPRRKLIDRPLGERALSRQECSGLHCSLVDSGRGYYLAALTKTLGPNGSETIVRVTVYHLDVFDDLQSHRVLKAEEQAAFEIQSPRFFLSNPVHFQGDTFAWCTTDGLQIFRWKECSLDVQDRALFRPESGDWGKTFVPAKCRPCLLPGTDRILLVLPDKLELHNLPPFRQVSSSTQPIYETENLMIWSYTLDRPCFQFSRPWMLSPFDPAWYMTFGAPTNYVVCRIPHHITAEENTQDNPSVQIIASPALFRMRWAQGCRSFYRAPVTEATGPRLALVTLVPPTYQGDNLGTWTLVERVTQIPFPNYPGHTLFDDQSGRVVMPLSGELKDSVKVVYLA